MATLKIKNRLDNVPFCPSCDSKLDGFAYLEDDDRRPSRGDISVCAYCAEILVFCKGLNLKRATAVEICQVDFLELQKVNGFVAHIRRKGNFFNKKKEQNE
jgi:hypothetical protein